ncbi:MAG: PAS domain S-box protein [Methylobacteriaceae bacterium]|nr:PAS domain S-box protein [Methylobacteriaceae bacterium]
MERPDLNHSVAPTSTENWTEEQRLEALESYGILDTAPEPAFDDIAKLAALTCDTPIALVSLVGAERQWFKSQVGLGMQETPRSASICATALHEKDLLVVPDLTRDPRFSSTALVTGEPHVRFYAGAVLRTPQGLPLGTVCVLDHKPRPQGLKEGQAFTLRVLARQVMTQMQLRRALLEREKALSEQEDALAGIRESEERFRVIANSAPVPIWVTSRTGPREFTNFAYQEFLGVSYDEALTFDWRRAIHPDHLPRLLKEQVAGESSGQTFTLECVYKRADGEWRWLRSISQPRFGPHGERNGFIGIAHDITASKQAEQDLQQMNQLLEERVTEALAKQAQTEETLRQSQKMEAVGQLTGGLAHDFNNLLAGIVGSLDLMRMRLAQGRTEALERYIDGATNSANRAAALTHRLLAFSRRQPLAPRPVDVNELITSMEELLRRTTGPSIQIELGLESGLWATLCDPNQLENAILNLVINARDAMPDGGRVRIETANTSLDARDLVAEDEERPGSYVCISVSDTGVGIDPAILDKVFDPFFTTKPLGQGTGLGLSMIYGFAKQSDGYARIHSEVDRGTSVKLYLPRHQRVEEEVAPQEPEQVEREKLGAATVLVVEDEAIVRSLIVEVLEDLGYRVLEAADGPAGHGILQSHEPIALLITDVGLPGMNGRQLADAARERRPGLKTIFVTGYAESAMLTSGKLDPGMMVVTKPFAVDALEDNIRKIMQA